MQISYLPIQLNKDFQSESVFASEKLILFMVMKKMLCNECLSPSE